MHNTLLYPYPCFLCFTAAKNPRRDYYRDYIFYYGRSITQVKGTFIEYSSSWARQSNEPNETIGMCVCVLPAAGDG